MLQQDDPHPIASQSTSPFRGEVSNNSLLALDRGGFLTVGRGGEGTGLPDLEIVAPRLVAGDRYLGAGAGDTGGEVLAILELEHDLAAAVLELGDITRGLG